MSTNLNEGQQKAVCHKEGPMLVLAGPGSGKTTVITERVHELIAKHGVNPSKILVITFTKAAAMEMKTRYQKKYPKDAVGTRFGTFHAVFFMILRYAYHYTADNIIRDDWKRDLLKQLIREEDLEIQDENEFIHDLEAEISLVKGSRLDLNNYYSGLCAAEVFRSLFHKYQKSLERKRLIDFDDMLVYCYELFDGRPDILAQWQQQFSYILIDEFQDICQVQYDIVKMLAAPENNLFIVGDDDQSIYGFRGAKPDIMKQFLKDYKDAKQCVLDINYRCAPEIVAAAGRVIGQNKNRLEKRIRPFENVFSEQGDRDVLDLNSAALNSVTLNLVDSDSAVTLKEFPKITEQNEWIKDQILAYRNQGIPYSEMAVLFRTNTQGRALSSKLMEYQIPFTMKERIPNLYDHWIVQDVLAYIKIALGNRERGLFLRIINRPKRYVHRNAFTEPYVDFEELKMFYEEKEWMVERLEQLQYELSMLRKMRPYAAVNFIRKGIGYNEYIHEYADYRGIRADDMMEILDELQEEAKSQDSFEDWFDYMERYREELIEKSQKQDSKDKENQDAVELLTMHGAKGLEYTCVFIPDANEGVTPHNKSILAADMEEERRMFYVAMTRAKKYLHISYLKERFNKEVDVSRFVQEIAE